MPARISESSSCRPTSISLPEPYWDRLDEIMFQMRIRSRSEVVRRIMDDYDPEVHGAELRRVEEDLVSAQQRVREHEDRIGELEHHVRELEARATTTAHNPFSHHNVVVQEVVTRIIKYPGLRPQTYNAARAAMDLEAKGESVNVDKKTLTDAARALKREGDDAPWASLTGIIYRAVKALE